VSLDARARAHDDGVGAGLDPLHVYAHRAFEENAEVCGAASEVCGVSAGDERLRRHAAGVDARPAEELPLNEGHRHASPSQPPGKRRAGLASADDDRVELSHRISTAISSAPPMATASSVCDRLI
jgi:hypothetical protein